MPDNPLIKLQDRERELELLDHVIGFVNDIIKDDGSKLYFGIVPSNDGVLEMCFFRRD